MSPTLEQQYLGSWLQYINSKDDIKVNELLTKIMSEDYIPEQLPNQDLCNKFTQELGDMARAKDKEILNTMQLGDQMDTRSILEERGNRYGEFSSHAVITQDIKYIMHMSPNWISELTPSMKEALDMVAHKIGRILNGDPFYDDSWIDICGYSQLVVDELRKDMK